MVKRRKKRKPYELQHFKAVLSTGLRELERIILTAKQDDFESIIKACNSLATLANSYRNLTESTDLLTRIEKLEEKINVEK